MLTYVVLCANKAAPDWLGEGTEGYVHAVYLDKSVALAEAASLNRLSTLRTFSGRPVQVHYWVLQAEGCAVEVLHAN